MGEGGETRQEGWQEAGRRTSCRNQKMGDLCSHAHERIRNTVRKYQAGLGSLMLQRESRAENGKDSSGLQEDASL